MDTGAPSCSPSLEGGHSTLPPLHVCGGHLCWWVAVRTALHPPAWINSRTGAVFEHRWHCSLPSTYLWACCHSSRILWSASIRPGTCPESLRGSQAGHCRRTRCLSTLLRADAKCNAILGIYATDVTTTGPAPIADRGTRVVQSHGGPEKPRPACLQ